MRTFSARETEWLEKLDGIELAGFGRRALAFVLDVVLILVLMLILGFASVFLFLKIRAHFGHPMPADLHFSLGPDKLELTSKDPGLERRFEGKRVQVFTEILVPILYFGLLTWQGKGRSPGKRLLRIRVVSLVHRHLTLWHSIERALGYGAAALEGGFGFVQFFIHPYRRCVQDRIAETIVVTERSYREMQRKGNHLPLPDPDRTPARQSPLSEAREAAPSA